MSTFDASGLTVDRQEEIFGKLSDKIKGKWGANHRTDAKSVTGQIIGIFSEFLGDQNELLMSLSTIYRPSNAFGVWLSEIVKLNNIRRKEQAKTTITIQVTANSYGSKIFKNDMVDTELGSGPFIIDNDVELAPSETKSVTVKAAVVGPIEVEIDTLTKILTPRLGWASVTNSSKGIPGAVEESDSALHWRREQTASAVGQNTTSRLYDRLLDLEDVSQINVIENDGTDTDVYGVPPQHIMAIVYGGTDAGISEVLYNVVGGGIGTYGTSSYLHVDPVRGISKTFNYTRSIDSEIKVQVLTRKSSKYPSNGDDLMAIAIVKYFDDVNVRLGGLVARGDLYASCYEIPGHQIQAILIARSIGTLAGADIQLDPHERPVCSLSGVTVVPSP